MFWWLNFNPQMNGWALHWPWSGAVAQDITSNLWSRARNSRVERRGACWKRCSRAIRSSARNHPCRDLRKRELAE
jgi:hypothetical protein